MKLLVFTLALLLIAALFADARRLYPASLATTPKRGPSSRHHQHPRTVLNLTSFYEETHKNDLKNKHATYAAAVAAARANLKRTTIYGAAFVDANERLFTVLAPWLQKILKRKLNSLMIPSDSESWHGIDITLTNIVVHEYLANAVTMSVQNDLIMIAITNASVGGIALDYSAKFGFLHSSGSCDVNIQNLDATFSAHFGPPTAEMKPTADVSAVSFSVGDINPHCSGAVGWLVDAFTFVIKHLAQSIFGDVAAKLLQVEIDSRLANTSLALDFDEMNSSTPAGNVSTYFAVADFNWTSQSTIQGGRVFAALAGLVVPFDNQNISFPAELQPPKTMTDVCSTDSRMLTLGLDASFFFGTMSYTYFQAGRLRTTLRHAIPADFVSLLLPGFAALPKDARLDLTIAATSYPAFNVTSASGLSGRVNLNITLNHSAPAAGGGKPLFFTMAAEAVAGVLVESNSTSGKAAVSLKISACSLLHAVVVASNVGGEGSPALVKLFDDLLAKFFILPLNWFLKGHHIPLPVVEGFELRDLDITYAEANNVVCVAANVQPAD